MVIWYLNNPNSRSPLLSTLNWVHAADVSCNNSRYLLPSLGFFAILCTAMKASSNIWVGGLFWALDSTFVPLISVMFGNDSCVSGKRRLAVFGSGVGTSPRSNLQIGFLVRVEVLIAKPRLFDRNSPSFRYKFLILSCSCYPVLCHIDSPPFFVLPIALYGTKSLEHNMKPQTFFIFDIFRHYAE